MEMPGEGQVEAFPETPKAHPGGSPEPAPAPDPAAPADPGKQQGGLTWVGSCHLPRTPGLNAERQPGSVQMTANQMEGWDCCSGTAF